MAISRVTLQQICNRKEYKLTNILHINLNHFVSTLYRHLSEHLIKNECNLSVYYPTGKDFKINNMPRYLIADPILNKYERILFNKRNEKITNQLEKRIDIKNIDILNLLLPFLFWTKF